MLASFDYVANDDAVVLILGSMPGKKSLDDVQYYAHPRNAFWPIAGALCGFSPEENYSNRLLLVKEHKIALWDVLKYCERASSLDSDIVESSITANDLGSFLECHKNIRLICFNGQKAAQSFNRYVRPNIATLLNNIELEVLPSTSPANAGASLEQKMNVWHMVLTPYVQ